jgi:hypothetical protein
MLETNSSCKVFPVDGCSRWFGHYSWHHCDSLHHWSSHPSPLSTYHLLYNDRLHSPLRHKVIINSLYPSLLHTHTFSLTFFHFFILLISHSHLSIFSSETILSLNWFQQCYNSDLKVYVLASLECVSRYHWRSHFTSSKLFNSNQWQSTNKSLYVFSIFVFVVCLMCACMWCDTSSRDISLSVWKQSGLICFGCDVTYKGTLCWWRSHPLPTPFHSRKSLSLFIFSFPIQFQSKSKEWE